MMRTDTHETPLITFLREFSLFLNQELEKRLPEKQENQQASIGSIASVLGAIPLAGSLVTPIAMGISNKRNLANAQEIVADEKNVIDFLKAKNKKEIDLALEELSDTSSLLATLNKLASDISMGHFTDREKKPDNSPPSKPLSEEAVTHAATRFRHFLEKEGLSTSDAQRISVLHEKFVQRELPEISVLAAVQELRDQFHGEPVKLKRPYQGKTKETEFPDSKKFLLHYYGEDIERGRLTSGQLYAIDPLLYNTLSRDLKPQGRSVADVVEPLGKPYARRAMACAAILGTHSAEEAGRYFGGIRADRIAKHEIG